MKPRKLRRAVIREELVALTGSMEAAVLLSQMLYWCERTKDTDEYIVEENNRRGTFSSLPSEQSQFPLTHGWIYKTAKQILEETMLGIAPSTVSKRLNELVAGGWLQRRNNPEYKWDRTWQYRVDLLKIDRDLRAIGYSLGDYSLYQTLSDAPEEPSIPPEEPSISPSEPSINAGEFALSETPSETPSDTSPQSPAVAATVADASVESDPPAREPRTRKKAVSSNAPEEDRSAAVETLPPKPRRQRSAQQQEEDAACKALEDEFVRLTGIPAPEGAARNSAQTRVRWWVPLRNMAKQCEWDLPLAGDILRSVVYDMRQRKLPVSAPQSVEKMFTAEYGLRRVTRQQAPVASSGGKPWWADGGSLRLPVQSQHGRGNDSG